MNKYIPTMHKEIPMETPVVIPAGMYSVGPLTGKVVGIASTHIMFYYIVLLDSPIENLYGSMRAVSVVGTALESPGGSNWRLEK